MSTTVVCSLGDRLVKTRAKRILQAKAPRGASSRVAPTPDSDTLARMLYYLKLTREAEHRIERVLYRQGKIVGGVYVGRGQEAIAVGSSIQTGEGDIVFPSHRDL